VLRWSDEDPSEIGIYLHGMPFCAQRVQSLSSSSDVTHYEEGKFIRSKWGINRAHLDFALPASHTRNIRSSALGDSLFPGGLGGRHDVQSCLPCLYKLRSSFDRNTSLDNNNDCREHAVLKTPRSSAKPDCRFNLRGY
jgi:hypothetical protein